MLAGLHLPWGAALDLGFFIGEETRHNPNPQPTTERHEPMNTTTPTLEQLGAEYEACVQRAKDASFYWRVNRELHGHFHWITMGLWDQLTVAWRASDRAWQAYNEAYQAVNS